MTEALSPDSTDASLRLHRVSSDSASDLVRRQLIEMIEMRRLAVGDRLPAEAELARTFGVSRPVVREALVSLRILGLTSPRSGSGTFVESNTIRMPLSFGGATSEQLNEVRRCLEVPCAGLAARNREDDDLAELGSIVEEFEGEGDPGRRVRIDSRFHVAVARATGNPLFARLVEDLRSAVEEQSLAVSLAPRRREQASIEHRAIFDAVRRGDAEQSEKLMRIHLDHLDQSIAILADSHNATSRATDGSSASLPIDPGCKRNQEGSTR